MIEKILYTKIGTFNITLDLCNIALGGEIDFDRPFSIDVYLPFIKLGWQMPFSWWAKNTGTFPPLTDKDIEKWFQQIKDD